MVNHWTALRARSFPIDAAATIVVQAGLWVDGIRQDRDVHR